ncbi:ATP-binding protein [Actinacidiphila oryziradicis]|uniref:ATP-binding protein n=2 Tax=Actinacidiphila oryziradicis TaxID=2571141 RepID=A0A4V5N3A3_9ACTN|nr:ATP-binding protein [Actinacidiphila oryziradicis]
MTEDHTSGRFTPESDKRAFGDTPESVGAARTFVSDALGRWGIAERQDDIRLCVSEMVTNALAHGASASCGFILRVIASAQQLRVEVEDLGGGQPVRRTPGWEDTSGRGLLLVDELADDWGVDEQAVGKTVWSVFMLAETAARRTAAVTC